MIDAGRERRPIVAHVRHHHDFLERGVAGPLADAVDRALDLARAGADGGEAVGDRQPEIVVTVRAEDRLDAFGTPAMMALKNSSISSGVQ